VFEPFEALGSLCLVAVDLWRVDTIKVQVIVTLLLFDVEEGYLWTFLFKNYSVDTSEVSTTTAPSLTGVLPVFQVGKSIL
jgi:hypothetical protein